MRPKVFGMISSADAVRYTRVALQSFFAHTPLNPGDRFVLIDNDSSLDPAELHPYEPWIDLVQHDELQSFAKNGNIAMSCALDKEADFYFFNNDLVFSPSWIEPLLIEAPVLLFPACNMQFRYATKQLSCSLQMELDDYLGREEEFLSIVKKHCSVKRGYKLHHSVPYYCVKIPLEVCQTVGLFDEAYCPIGWEDIDYTLRCYLKGFRLKFALDSFIIHFYGKSTWRKDGKEKNEKTAPATNKEGLKPVEVFEQKWSKELASIFAYQDPESQAKLRAFEENVLVKGYGDLIRKLRT